MESKRTKDNHRASMRSREMRRKAQRRGVCDTSVYSAAPGGGVNRRTEGANRRTEGANRRTEG
eukprot:299019-Prorocentrum_minimum.AAC.1